MAYHNAATGQVVLSYRGTDGLGDLKADTNFVTGGWSQQFTDAAQFTSSVRNTLKENPAYTGSTLLATGHSLGDGIAQIMGQMFDLIGAGFEGPGAARVVANPQFAAIKAQYAPDTNGQIGAYTTYRASGSVISDTGTHLGNTHNMVNLAEGGVLGFTGAVIGIAGFAAGGAGGVL